MRVTCDNGTYTLACDRGELSLVVEGLYAVEVTDRRCLRDDVPDEFDRPELESEIRLLSNMRDVLAVILEK